MQSMIRYVYISLLSLSINIILTVLPHETLHIPAELSRAFAIIVVLVVNFFSMRYYIYHAASEKIWKQFLVYAPSALGFRLGEYGAFLIGYTWMQMNYCIVTICISCIATVIKFFYYRILFEQRMRWRQQREVFPQSIATHID